jgi:hypothetical protein
MNRRNRSESEFSRKAITFEDPIVAEVHAVRAQLAAECGHDSHKLSERTIEVQRRYAGQIKTVSKEELQRIRRGEAAPTDK